MSDEDFRLVLVGGDNLAELATLSGGSYEATLPRTNLQDRDLGVVARTTDTLLASTKILIDLGANAYGAEAVVLTKGNWSLDSLVRIKASHNADLSSPVHDTGWISFPGFVVESVLLPYDSPDFWTGVLSDTLLAEHPRNLIWIIPEDDVTPTTPRYWSIEFDDQNNAAGYLQYSYLMMARVFRPSINYGPENNDAPFDLADISTTIGGRRDSTEYGVGRRWSGAFNYLGDEELRRSFHRMVVQSRTTRPVFVVPQPTDLVYLQQRSFLAFFKQMSAVKQLLVVNTGATAIDLEEVL